MLINIAHTSDAADRRCRLLRRRPVYVTQLTLTPIVRRLQLSFDDAPTPHGLCVGYNVTTRLRFAGRLTAYNGQ